MTRFGYRVMVGLMAIAAVPFPACAQDDIVVTGTPLAAPPGTPAYGSVTIARDRLTGDASGRIEDVLADVAGFQQFRRSDSRSANPSAQGVTLRAIGGNATSRSLVLLDGVPIADPFFGYIPFNAVVPAQLGSARVTRGGGSGAFGAGAVAGVIELTSASRRDLSPLSANAAYGSFNAQTIDASVSPTIGAGFASLSGRFDRADGFFTTPPAQRVPASARAAYRDWSVSLRGVAPIGDDTEVQTRLTAFGDDRTLRFQGADSRSEGQDASIRLIHRGAWQVDAIAYLQARNFANRVISATSFRLTLDQRRTPSTGLGGKIELRPPVGGDHVLRFGVDARLADGALFEDAYNPASGLVTARRTAGGSTLTVGGFVEDDWTIGPVVLTGGLRVDNWAIADGFFREASGNGTPTIDRRFADRSGTEVNGRVGALWHATPALTIRAAAYTGFRLPTLNELYRPFVVVPVTTQANEALAPERLRGGELGVDLTPARGVALGLTLFHNRLDGAIGNVTIAANLRQRRNLHAIVAQGVELTAAAARGPWSLSASYAFSDSRVVDASPLDGLRPAQSPRHSASATIGWQPGTAVALSATLRHVGSQFEDDLATDMLPAATTLDTVARLNLTDRLALVLRGENVTDTVVVTRNAGGSIDRGTPRTLWIGLRIGG